MRRVVKLLYVGQNKRSAAAEHPEDVIDRKIEVQL